MIEKAIIKQTHLVKKTVRIEADQLPALFEYTEYLPFEFGIYKDGPTFFEITPSQYQEEKQTYDVYIPINTEVASTDDFTYVPSLEIKGVRKRVPFDEGLDEHLNSMKDYMQEEGLAIPDKLFLIITPVYGQLFADIIIPEEN